MQNKEQKKKENEKGKIKTKHELFIRSLHILPQKERLCVVRKLEAGKYLNNIQSPARILQIRIYIFPSLQYFCLLY